MPVTFRCKCGQTNRVPDGTRTARCPDCLRTVHLPNPLAVWGLAGAVAMLLVGVGLVVAAVLPRGNANAAAVIDPPTTPAAAPTFAKLPNPTARPVAPPPTTPKPTAPNAGGTPALPDSPPPKPVPPDQPKPVVPVVPDPPRVGKLVVEPAGRYKVGDTCTQDVTVTRLSAVSTLGIGSTNGATYTLASTLEVTAVHDNGSVTVTQTVTGGKLIDATPDMKQPLADAIKEAVGAKFELEIGPTGKVSSLKGLADPIKVKVGRDVERQTLRLWSVLDADAWKELAGVTFFQPDKPGAGEKWSRDFAHDWAQLGSWAGRTDYITAAKPDKDGTLKTDYAHGIRHLPPKKAGGLPFAMTGVIFPNVKAGGALKYDPTVRRVTAAEETFHVRGGLSVDLGGGGAAVEVEEKQVFGIKVGEVKAKALVGNKK